MGLFNCSHHAMSSGQLVSALVHICYCGYACVYEDEPEVSKSEIKDALLFIPNRKAA